MVHVIGNRKNPKKQLIHIRVGNDHRPATVADINDTTTEIENDVAPHFPDALFFVTHHAYKIDVIDIFQQSDQP